MSLFVCSKCGAGHSRFRGRLTARPASYCAACHAEFMRLTRPKYSELTAEEKRKANCRAHARTAQRRGQIQPKPCEVCGTEKAQKHHEDYSKALEVRWLCAACHLTLHKEPWRLEASHGA